MLALCSGDSILSSGIGGDRLVFRGFSRESHVRLVEETLPSSLASAMRSVSIFFSLVCVLDSRFSG